MALDQRRILAILESIDWIGHVELGIGDMKWLANELALHLTNPSRQRCDSCGAHSALCVSTPLGKICRDCIEVAQEKIDEAEDTIIRREVAEDGWYKE